MFVYFPIQIASGLITATPKLCLYTKNTNWNWKHFWRSIDRNDDEEEEERRWRYAKRWSRRRSTICARRTTTSSTRSSSSPSSSSRAFTSTRSTGWSTRVSTMPSKYHNYFQLVKIDLIHRIASHYILLFAENATGWVRADQRLKSFLQNNRKLLSMIGSRKPFAFVVSHVCSLYHNNRMPR